MRKHLMGQNYVAHGWKLPQQKTGAKWVFEPNASCSFHRATQDEAVCALRGHRIVFLGSLCPRVTVQRTIISVSANSFTRTSSYLTVLPKPHTVLKPPSRRFINEEFVRGNGIRFESKRGTIRQSGRRAKLRFWVHR